MTVATTVNSMTNNSYGSTAVTAAITAAETFIDSEIEDAYVAGNDATLDLAVALTAKEILEQGRNASKRKTSDDTYSNSPYLTKEVKGLLAKYNVVRNQTVILVDTRPRDSDHWIEY